MKLKLDDQNHAVLQDGKPVYIHADGKEVAFDAAQAFGKIGQLTGENTDYKKRFLEAEALNKTFEGLSDPQAAIKALETIKNIDEGKLVAAGKVEEIKFAAAKAAQEQVAAANKTMAEELAKAKQRGDNYERDLYTEKIGGSFMNSEFIAKRIDMLPDFVQAKFGSSFKVEDGKTVAYDASGNKIFSRTRPGEIADFDEALATLVDQHPQRDRILKGSGATGSGSSSSTGVNGSKTISRAQLEALPLESRGAALKGVTLTD